MTTGSNKKTVQEKLVTVQEKLAVTKTGRGRFGDFANLQDMLGALKPLLSEQRLSLILDNEIIEVGERTYVQATVYLSDGDGIITAKAQAWEGDISRGLDSSQVTGSASTYARKYALAGLFAITDGSKDADSHKDDPAPVKALNSAKPAQSDKDPATDRQKQQLKNMMVALSMEPDAMGMMVESVLEKPKVETYADFKAVVKALEETTDEKDQSSKKAK